MKDVAAKESFIERRARGWSFDRISKDLHISKATLVSWSKDLTLEIRNRRELEREALLEQVSLTHEAKIQFLGDLMTKIRQELLSRNLVNVPTDRLFEMTLKVLDEWRRIPAELRLGIEEDLTVSLTKSLDKTVVNWSA